jgi:MFS family permease
VLGVYTLILEITLPGAALLARTWGGARVAAAGSALFALSSLACGLVDSVSLLLILRGVEAVGAAGTLVGGFILLDGGRPGPGRRLWFAASIFGAAIGPALGGVLTELFDWRAIFLAQVPLGCLSAAACLASPVPHAVEAEPGPIARRPRTIGLGPALALALVSAALSGVLFLLVLLLVSGWSISPLAAAAAVTVLPAAALVGMRIPGSARPRAIAGCGLVGAGVAALAFLTTASVGWTLLPQLLAGVGMGLALTSLVGPLVPERTPADTALVLAIRHGGITLALLLLAPITAAQLDTVAEDTRERGRQAGRGRRRRRGARRLRRPGRRQPGDRPRAGRDRRPLSGPRPAEHRGTRRHRPGRRARRARPGGMRVWVLARGAGDRPRRRRRRGRVRERARGRPALDRRLAPGGRRAVGPTRGSPIGCVEDAENAGRRGHVGGTTHGYELETRLGQLAGWIERTKPSKRPR